MTTSYITGTVSVETGSRTVIGVGTGWQTANISPGFFGLDNSDGSPVPVETVVSDTELLLYTPWRGASASGSGYWLSYDTRDGQQTVNNAIRLSDYIARLDSASLSAIAGLSPSEQMLILFTGPNTATLIGRDELGFSYDEQVPDLAGRAQYDGAPANFRVLVIDAVDGRSAFYVKNSAASGDWSDPVFFTGSKGDTGESGPFTQIVTGTTTTLPSGSDATVTPRDVSPGVVALDFGIPKGEDGSGTGDVVGPSGSTDGYLAAFNGTTGKLLKQQALSSFAASILDDNDGAAVWSTLGGTSWGDSSNGGVRLPNGTIFQWGLVPSLDSNGGATVTYPQSFPSVIFGFYPVVLTAFVSGSHSPIVYQSWDWGPGRLSSQTVWCRAGGSPLVAANVRWFAVGR